VRSYRVRSLIVVSVSASLLALGACGEETPSDTPSATPAASGTPSGSASPSAAPKKIPASNNFDKVAVTGDYGKPPKVTVKTPMAIDKTRTKVLKASDGADITDGASVELNYYGVNARTGKKFDDSYSRKQTATFALDQVVPGFKKGLLGQKQGSRVVIAMPGSDGYDGSGGNPEAGIEVGDTLLFVVDVVGVPLTGPAGTPVTPAKGLPTVVDQGGKPQVTVPKADPPAALKVQPLIMGTGKVVTAADTITFNYTWLNWSEGKVLEQSYGGQPASAPLSGLLAGMQKGLAGQPVGSRVLLVIPPAEGYPAGNETPKIDKTETTVMVVDLLFTQAAQ